MEGVEFWFGIMNKKVLNESYGFAGELMKSFDAFLEEWNNILAHPFRWSYTGEGLCGKAINRFTEILKCSARKLEISSLTKQLQLVINLFEQYFSDIPLAYWERFFAVFRANRKILLNTIDNEVGPRKKENAQKAFEILSKIANDFIYQTQVTTA